MDYQIKHANGLDFAYYEMGTGDDFVFCFHGFPDTADTWLELMPVLADAGYHVIAPFMRGYPPTEIPADGQYSVKHLAQDVITLIDAFDAGSVICIGHDWGALTLYAASALAPGRISKMVTVAIAHPRTLRFDLKTLWKARHFLTFQLRGLSISWMKRNNFSAIGKIFRRWSPNWQFTDADIAPIRKSLSQPGGVEGALGYYWSFRDGQNDDEVQGLLRAKTSVPTLSIFGEIDGALTLDALAHTPKAFTNDYQQVVLPDVGHFLHREAPDKFAELVLQFLSED
ncbi:MAG: alpha/beta fold hydrolase [Aggregatilineales bacterium]